MPENSVVRARIDERIKSEAAAVLAAMELTVSDAFRLMMMRIAKDKALPFEPLVPNDETIEAMRPTSRLRWRPATSRSCATRSGSWRGHAGWEKSQSPPR